MRVILTGVIICMRIADGQHLRQCSSHTGIAVIDLLTLRFVLPTQLESLVGGQMFCSIIIDHMSEGDHSESTRDAQIPKVSFVNKYHLIGASLEYWCVHVVNPASLRVCLSY